MIKKLLSPGLCNLVVALLGMFWLSALAGFAFLTNYDFAPGTRGLQPMQWPEASHLQPANDRCTAIVFLHPRCGCSLATSTELAKIMQKVGGKLKVYALVRPTLPERAQAPLSEARELPRQDNDSPLIKSIDAIPGISRIADFDSREGKLFGAETSGNVLLYNKKGRLLFAGGITASRGHEGDNCGADAMIAAVQDSRRITISTTPVFGCSLLEK